MNVYGELTKAQVENRTADPSLASSQKGRIWFRTDLSSLKIDLGGSADTFARLAAAQTFTGSNTFTPTQIFSTGQTNAQISTPSNPASGFNKVYPKSDDNFYTLNSAGTEAKVLTSLNAFAVPTIQKFLSTGSTTGYLFTVSSASATAGATYTNNGNTYTVLYTISASTFLICSQASAPLSSGTLTKATGSGDATITFSAAAAMATYTKPANVLYLGLKMVGGGGGGGGSGTADGTVGGTGGISAFGNSICTGGVGSQVTTIGAVGSATLGSNVFGTALSGTAGSPNTGSSGSVTQNGGGNGGSSPLSGRGRGGQPSGAGSATGGAAVANTGSGGGGGGSDSTVNIFGGCGGSSGGWIDAVITTLSSTFPYCIGAAGAAGGLGTSGVAGGPGAIGYIQVTELYQ